MVHVESQAIRFMIEAVTEMEKSVANMMLVVEQCSADTITHERYNEDSCRPGWEEDYNSGGF